MTNTRPFSPERLRGLFEPQSIALVGASEKSSWSWMVHNNLTVGGFDGRVYYINPRSATVHGQPAVPRLADIGDAVDLAYIMVPGDAVLPVVREMAVAGIHNAIVLTAGFAEVDRKSTRLNSSHQIISYAVFCLKKNKGYRPVLRQPRYL